MEVHRPIFVVGFPRSGTTYLQSLLATQKSVVSFPETHFYSILTGHLNTSEGISSKNIDEIIESAHRMMQISFSVEERDELKKAASTEKLARRDLFIRILDRILEKRGEVRETSNVIVEKTPSHARHLEEIIADFPDARIIHIARHPLDSIRSYHFKLSKGEKDLSELIKEWSLVHDKVEEFKKVQPNKVLTISYESLIKNRIEVMNRVMNFLDMPFDETLLDNFHVKAKALIMDFEDWKLDNTSSSEGMKPEKLSLKESLTIQYCLLEKIKHEGFEVRYPLIQWVYNWKNKKS